MRWVRDVYAEGVSGSQIFNREDIQELLDLQKTDPFDVVAVHDLSRLTRGGIRHGNVLEDTLRKAGLEVISTTDFIPDGPEGELIKSVKHYSNQLQARSISLAVARGLSQSLARNSRPACGHSPYGTDRLYYGPDGKSRMLVRWDGLVQIWLNPETLEEIGRRVKPRRLTRQERQQLRRGSKGRQKFKGYTKQPDESSRLVPGAKDRLETLIWMFTVYFVSGWGYHRIAQNLNERMVKGPEGGQWNLKSVRSILFNPIYLGVEVRHRWSEALYNKITADGPVPVYVDQYELEREKRTSVPHLEQPRSDWKLVDVPGLKDLLPSPLREIAAETKQLLAVMIDDLKIDLATHELSFNVVLPEIFFRERGLTLSKHGNTGMAGSDPDVRPDCQLPWLFAAAANSGISGETPATLGRWTCRRPEPACYVCHRRNRAA